MNNLAQLSELGVSIWLDDLSAPGSLAVTLKISSIITQLWA